MARKRRYVLYKNNIVFDRHTKKFEAILPEFMFEDGFIRFDEPYIGPHIKTFEPVIVSRKEYCKAGVNHLNGILYGRI